MMGVDLYDMEDYVGKSHDLASYSLALKLLFRLPQLSLFRRLLALC